MPNKNEILKNRDIYLKQLITFQDTEPVKVITGIRRCGKSSLMKLMVRHLKESGVLDAQIIHINFESHDYSKMNSDNLYDFVKSKTLPDKRMYLLFDEIQRVENWEDTINAFRVDLDCDIYITGSNACLLSSEYSTYLSGRYVEIKMLPLSFREFLDFHDYSLLPYLTPMGENRIRVQDDSGNVYDTRELFDAYMKYGGMPGIASAGWNQDIIFPLLDGVFSTVVIRDIMERELRRGNRQITDYVLLKKIVLFLADNIGNTTSLNTIGNTLVSERMLEKRNTKGKPAVNTISAYIRALIESYFFYEIKRFDIKGKDYLRTLGKYYIVDVGLRNYLLGYRDIDTGHVIENIVYFELLRRGFDVAVGKIGDKEVDFIATNADTKIYYQVTEEMSSEATRERELSPLRSIPDNYGKVVIVLNNFFTPTQDGIKIISLLDFLLS